MLLQVTVITQKDPLNKRQNAGTSFPVIGQLAKGTTLTVDDSKDVGGVKWYRDQNGGWLCGTYLRIDKDLEQKPVAESPAPPLQETNPPPQQQETQSVAEGQGIDPNLVVKYISERSKKELKVDASTRLFGSPHQFTSETDFRLNTGFLLGRKYIENIIAEAPIVYFVPGKPKYLPDISSKEREALDKFFLEQTAKSGSGESSSLLTNILKGQDARYFDFMTDYSDYIRYVNLLCRIAAIYIGIGDKKFGAYDREYKYFDWENYKFKNDFKQEPRKKSVFSSKFYADAAAAFTEDLFGRYKYVQFYCEPNTSYSESASNNTTSSMLAGKIEQIEGIAKEIAFLQNAGALQDSFLQEGQEAVTTRMHELADKLKKDGSDTFFSRVLGTGSQIIKGSNIMFPDLWSESSYNKSYSVTINLVSPYGDKEAVYLNILVPLMHILAFTLPRQTSANTFKSPFLVKVFAKGWFSCELGMVDSISIDKGGSGESWTVDGLPTEVKVTISVRDLYANLMLSSATEPIKFFENRGLIDFLAVTCGVDITKPQFLTKLETIQAVFTSKVIDLPSNVYKEFVQKVRESIEPVLRI